MQSWPGSGQSGAGGQTSWQGAFPYGQDDHFDSNQVWPQSVADHAGSFSHMSNTQDAHTQNFFNSPSHQDDAFLGGSLHPSQPGNPSFHDLGLDQQFSQAGQDVMDPAFSNLHPDLYGQHAKGNLNLNQVQTHPHGHGQGFPRHEFQFPAQNEQAFNPSVSQYNANQLISRAPSQHNHSPIQHFDTLRGGFQQDQPFPHQPQQPSAALHQQSFSHAPNFVHNAVKGQRNHFAQDSNPHITYHQQQPRPQGHNQQALDPASFAPQKLPTYSQPGQGSPAGHHAHLSGIDNSTGQPNTSPAAGSLLADNTPSELNSGHVHPSPVSTSDSFQPKKRKRVSKASTESPLPTVEVPPATADFPVDSSSKRAEDLDSLPVPEPSAEEAKLISDFGKRNKTAQVRYPTIKGLPYMVYEGSVKLPAPKSYDKLAPLVALPPKSGRPIVPQLGYPLPCEVQGRFSSKYRPSLDKSGLDERRAEAKTLLDEYDRSMQALGKRQPKYTEYPHAFKEQLKSDEASKNKAEKKAKKELEDERNKPVRQASRPNDPVEAVVWDIVGIIHIDQATPRTSSLIAGRVQQAGEFFVKLRAEINRSKLDLEEAIKNKEPETVTEKKRVEAEQKKEALYRALDATVEHADDAVLDNLGGHQKLVLSLVNTLISSIKASDFSGKLPKIVLELFTHFRITKKIVDTTNFDSVRKRLEDKGDDEVKELVREISAKIKKFQRANEPTTATGYTGTSAASRAKAGGKLASDGTSTKRGRDEELDTRTVKKIAVEAGAGSLSKKLAQPKGSQSTGKITASKQATSVLPGKPRPIAKTVARPELLGADSPNTSSDDKNKSDAGKLAAKADSKPGPASKTENKGLQPKSVSSSASALSGIASLLDSINAKKPEVAPATSKDSKGPDDSETPEQRAKRIRKEGRRKLRVSWKPEGELVQVQVFHKDDEEDEGRDVNMLRDAGDDRSEGMVLKQRADVDDEDDDDDIPYQPWVGPTATDFTQLPPDVRCKNYVTRGGNVAFETSEQKEITARGQRELMAIYTNVDDIPPSPKSPPQESSSPAHSKACYLPTEGAKFEELQLRWRDEQNMGLDQALGAALRRIDAKNHPSNKLDDILGRLKGAPDKSSSHQATSHPRALPGSSTTQHNFPFAVGSSSEAQVLACLCQEKITAWRDPNPVHVDPSRPHQYGDANLQMIGNHIESVARSLAGKPYPATAPPEWLTHDEERIREWWLGYNKEAAARQRKLDEERARSEAEANAMRVVTGASGQPPDQDWNAHYQQQSYAPYLALLQQMTGGQAAGQTQGSSSQGQQSSIPDSQLQSILAAINQPQQQQAQSSNANPLANLSPSDPSYQQLVMLTQLAQGHQQGQPPPPPPPPPPSNERDWDRGEKEGKESRKKKATLPPHKPANKALIGTKACTFWQQGKCARGEKCTFRHD
ncbi:zinc finger protein [Metarhizium album ARSEF 1941]|uniref:Zinc finger protein n=1 Tax=Metarhizium album (strain ARSEF 1941) TaxID=1081103 RepID=A0A0B2WSC9_METAS|nr:zinc finger protein [Metarhizium album ARSEF 1941]KHN96534.1 zinc finger protein [Metarhizium album ARSEF 1941]